MEAYSYETFLRRAFGYKLNDGKFLDRWGYPAGLANTDSFRNDRIHLVKSAVIHSMEIFILDIINHEKVKNDTEYDRLNDFTSSVMDAPDLKIFIKLTEFPMFRFLKQKSPQRGL